MLYLQRNIYSKTLWEISAQYRRIRQEVAPTLIGTVGDT